MTLTLKQLIGYLEIKDLRLAELKKRVIDVLGNPLEMQLLLNEQYVDKDETNCILCEDDGDCAILTGVMRFDLHANGAGPIPPSKKNNRELAILELELAKIRLHNKAETWNWIVGMVILGLVQEADGKKYLALREYKEAHEVLRKYYLRIYRNEYIAEAQLLEAELTLKLQQLSTSRLNPPPVAPAPMPPAPAKPAPATVNPFPEDIPPASKVSPIPAPMFANERDYLALFSIPVYGPVEAGPNGEFVAENPAEPFTMVDVVELHGKKYTVHNLRGTSPSDRQINISSDRSYAWLKVHGLSMNAWKTPINEGDYVLFCHDQNDTPSHGDFVIASTFDPSSEVAFIVKWYDDQNKLLRSKSNDAGKRYDPIPLDENHKIRGIVIAIAKPIE